MRTLHHPRAHSLTPLAPAFPPTFRSCCGAAVAPVVETAARGPTAPIAVAAAVIEEGRRSSPRRPAAPAAAAARASIWLCLPGLGLRAVVVVVVVLGVGMLSRKRQTGQVEGRRVGDGDARGVIQPPPPSQRLRSMGSRARAINAFARRTVIRSIRWLGDR